MPQGTDASFRSTALLAIVVVAAALAVHGRTLRYPLIQDDWGRLERSLSTSALTILREDFSPAEKVGYRPLGGAYFLGFARAFGFNPVPGHLVTLALHIGSSLLVVALVCRLTRDRAIGWIAGIVYAGESSVHLDPMIWMSGIYDSAAVFLALSSIWMFVNDRMWPSAISFGIAVLFKESALFVPVVACVVAWSERRSLRAVGPMLLVLALYVPIKMAGMSPLRLPEDHPYAIRVAGPHVLANMLNYARWSIDALLPYRPAWSTRVLLFALVSVVIAAWLGKRKATAEAPNWSGTAPLAAWIAASLSLVVFLPNHAYRYYLMTPLPALIASVLLSARWISRRFELDRRSTLIAMSLLGAASVGSSFEYFRSIERLGLNQPYLEGTNDLVRKAATVTAVRNGLLQSHPTLPHGAVLLFEGVEIWAFDKDTGPRIWYGDPTLRVYDAADVAEESGRLVVRNPSEDQTELFTGAPPREIALDCCPVFVFQLSGGSLTERPLESVRETLVTSRLAAERRVKRY